MHEYHAIVAVLIVGAAIQGQDQDVRPAQATEAAVARGRVLFHSTPNCVACHGEAGQGTPHGPDLSDAEWIRGRGTFEEIAVRVRHGVSARESSTGDAMPIRGMWGDLTDDDVTALAAYVWSLRLTPAKR